MHELPGTWRRVAKFCGEDVPAKLGPFIFHGVGSGTVLIRVAGPGSPALQSPKRNLLVRSTTADQGP